MVFSFLFSWCVSKYIAILSRKELPHVQISWCLFSDRKARECGVLHGQCPVRQKVTEGDQSDIRACYFLSISSVISYIDSAMQTIKRMLPCTVKDKFGYDMTQEVYKEVKSI